MDVDGAPTQSAESAAMAPAAVPHRDPRGGRQPRARGVEWRQMLAGVSAAAVLFDLDFHSHSDFHWHLLDLLLFVITYP